MNAGLLPLGIVPGWKRCYSSAASSQMLELKEALLLTHISTQDGSSATFVAGPDKLWHFDLIQFPAQLCWKSPLVLSHFNANKAGRVLVWLAEAVTVPLNGRSCSWGEKCDIELYHRSPQDNLKIIASFRTNSLTGGLTQYTGSTQQLDSTVSNSPIPNTLFFWLHCLLLTLFFLRGLTESVWGRAETVNKTDF